MESGREEVGGRVALIFLFLLTKRVCVGVWQVCSLSHWPLESNTIPAVAQAHCVVPCQVQDRLVRTWSPGVYFPQTAVGGVQDMEWRYRNIFQSSIRHMFNVVCVCVWSTRVCSRRWVSGNLDWQWMKSVYKRTFYFFQFLESCTPWVSSVSRNKTLVVGCLFDGSTVPTPPKFIPLNFNQCLRRKCLYNKLSNSFSISPTARWMIDSTDKNLTCVQGTDDTRPHLTWTVRVCTDRVHWIQTNPHTVRTYKNSTIRSYLSILFNQLCFIIKGFLDSEKEEEEWGICV